MTTTEQRSRNQNGDAKYSRPSTTREHNLAIFALCIVAFTHGYLVISAVPYSPFMVIDLISMADRQNVGYYAGLMGSSFMIGRALTLDRWGKVADVLGRKTTLIVSLCLSLCFSLLFGLSRNFMDAILWRFFLGMSDALLRTAKTVIVEISCGDEMLETEGSRIVNSMWTMSLLISPAVTGAIVQPIQQYPEKWFGWKKTALYRTLRVYPFYLPNALGALLCVISIVFVIAFIVEPLPSVRFSDVSHTPRNIFTRLRSMLSTIEEGDESSYLSMSKTASNYDSMQHSTVTQSFMTHTSQEKTLEQFTITDIEDAIRQSVMNYNEETCALAVVRSSRNKLAVSIAQHTNLTIEEKLQAISRGSSRSFGDGSNDNSLGSLPENSEPPENPPVSIMTLWDNESTRNHLLLHWMGSFIMAAVEESFPLFLLSQAGGLGLSVKAIGIILSVSSFLFILSQLFVYPRVVDKLGLYGSMNLGYAAIVPVVGAFPFVLLFNDAVSAASADDDGLMLGESSHPQLAWYSLTYLATLFAIFRVFFFTASSSLTIGLNRTIIADNRARTNGFNTISGLVAKSIGSLFSGILVAFSLSSGLFKKATTGTSFIFLMLVVIAATTAISSTFLLGEHYGSSNRKKANQK